MRVSLLSSFQTYDMVQYAGANGLQLTSIYIWKHDQVRPGLSLQWIHVFE